MMNQAMLDSVSYKTYYAIATGAEPPKPKKSQKKSDSTISSEESPSKKKPTKAKKNVPSTKKPATKPKPTKKKAPVKADRGKGLNVLSEVALSEAAQLKEATKRSKKDIHISYASGSGDGTNFESGGNSDEEYDDDEDDTKDDTEDESNDDKGNHDDGDNDDDDGDNDDNDDNDDDDMNDDDDKTDSDRTDSDIIKISDPNRSSTESDKEEEKMDEEEDDDITKELYKDVNVNLGKKDADMIHVDQGGEDLHNVSQESGFEQVEEDAHVTLTAVHDSQKTEGPLQSSSISSDLTSKLLNLENVSPADNEIASLMDTTIHHKEPSSQTSSLYTIPVMIIPEVTST
ncbi:hypothetical protein Tco_0585650, partial [Tanacetum coccineum]